MIYITEDGTWGNADSVMMVDIDTFAGDHSFEKILQDMYDGADATELWNYLK